MRKMITTLGIFLLLALLLISITGANPQNVNRDSSLILTPKVVILQNNLRDSLNLLAREKFIEDSVDAIKAVKSRRIFNLVNRLVYKKTHKPKTDTLFLFVPLDTTAVSDYALKVVDTPPVVKIDTVYLPHKKRGIFNFLKGKNKN